jgi:hypothetical protein
MVASPPFKSFFAVAQKLYFLKLWPGFAGFSAGEHSSLNLDGFATI